MKDQNDINYLPLETCRRFRRRTLLDYKAQGTFSLVQDKQLFATVNRIN